ncbi:PAS domain-containing protein [Caballeronia sp. dw_19]|uniref:PAS domain-containing protein n=1 Tax=Caballeronia sp. dw_19 TaxID=2719791 RepID=UPI0021041E76|nr:PAS domain-containing protein [Caballeronia sp. dw_19]
MTCATFELPQGDADDDWARQWVASTLDYSVFQITTDGKIASWNEGGIQIEGYQPEEIVGPPFSVLYTDNDRRNGTPDSVMDSVPKQDATTRTDGADEWTAAPSGQASSRPRCATTRASSAEWSR